MKGNKNRKNTKSTEALERELTSLERNLLARLREHMDQIRSSSSNRSAEFMDTVSNNELDELTARIAESDSTNIDRIEEALHRLREGRYGICSDCGRGISKKRLKARPFATLCIECKQKEEKQHMGSNGHGTFYTPYSTGIDATEAEGDGGSHDTIKGNKF